MKRLSELIEGRPRVTLPASTSVLVAARVMNDYQVGAVMVVGDEGEPLGVFTERDLMVRVIVAGHDPARTLLEKVMTRDILTGSPEEGLLEVAHRMQARHVRHLPVLKAGRFAGMLSLRDLLRELLLDKTREVEELTAYIQSAEPPE